MTRYQPYPEYKDSGVDWIGEIPKHWEVVQLKHLLREMGSGGTPDTKDVSNWADNPSDGIPWVSISDMSSCSRVTEVSKHLTSKGVESKDLRIWPEGTLLFSMYASLGHVSELAIRSTVNQAILALVPNHRIGQSYLTFSMKAIQKHLVVYAGSSTQNNLNAEKVRSLEFCVPLPDEQDKIENFLYGETTRLDTLIKKKERFIELLQEKRQALITQAVTKGLTNVPMKDSGVEWIGEVPAHWDVCRIATLFREAEREGDLADPVLSVSIHNGITDGELTNEERDRRVALSEDRSKYQGVEPGDLAYNMMRAWQGAFGAVAVKGLVSPAYVVAAPIRTFRTKFIEHLLHTNSAAEDIRRYSKGIADFRMRLYWEHFRNIRVSLPPLEEQDAILAALDTKIRKIESLVTATEKSVALLQEKRAALITAAVTGKIDVRGEAA